MPLILNLEFTVLASPKKRRQANFILVPTDLRVQSNKSSFPYHGHDPPRAVAAAAAATSHEINYLESAVEDAAATTTAVSAAVEQFD